LLDKSNGLLCSGLRLANKDDNRFVDDVGASVVLVVVEEGSCPSESSSFCNSGA